MKNALSHFSRALVSTAAVCVVVAVALAVSSREPINESNAPHRAWSRLLFSENVEPSTSEHNEITKVGLFLRRGSKGRSCCKSRSHRKNRECCSEQQTSVPPAPVWHSLFDGKSMGKWEISEFGPQGEIRVEKGDLILGVGDGCTGVTWKGDFPRVNYEIRLEARRVDGSDFFCGLTFPVKKDPCTFVVGGWGGATVGLSSIDGNDAARNATARYRAFKDKQWYKIRIRVTTDKIECWIDKEKIVDFDTRDRKLSIRPEVELSKPLGICSFCTTAGLRNIEYKLVDKPDSPVKNDFEFFDGSK